MTDQDPLSLHPRLKEKTETALGGFENSYQYGRHNWMKRPDDMMAGTGKM